MVVTVLTTIDGWLARSRPLWGWLGQVGLVVLGVHLAADHLDDGLALALSSVALPWPDPDTPRWVGTWVAVAVELATVAWALRAQMRTAAREPVQGAAGWRDRLSVHNVVAPLAWLPMALAGTWVVVMAVEDAAAAWVPSLATPVAWGVGGLVAWRVGYAGLAALIRRAPPPVRRTEGWLAALLVLPVAGLALRHGLPVWGWLP